MKISKILIASSLLGSIAFADGAFVGVSGAYNFKSQIKPDKSEQKGKFGKFDDKNAEFGIKAGYDFDSFRAYGAYVYGTKAKKDKTSKSNAQPTENLKIEWKSHNIVGGVDWTPEIVSGFKAVVGGYMGVSYAKSNTALKDSTGKIVATGSKNASGLITGIKLGGLYELDMHNEIEFGFKGENVKFKDANARNFGLYLGYNYKF
ncbi:hypothetical protein LMG7974_01306 [Campylobacter majalis]|uniref:Outer membrane beta-barrel protein n=1 Tax=Campylobacter majalis TaxID=2790656 RepID=A0ABN7KAD7_9BACT|nr:hypothetical protein [Campylobacter majalis]CAD7289050.1 hypothetical protein LMG7974_01306 [Campylobacter majalis]